MNTVENIKLALRSLKSNFLRTALTLMIIAVGIACLVGILTAIDGILNSMNDSFNRLGTNSFRIRPLQETIRSNANGRTVKRADPIVFDQAMTFKEKYSYGTTRVSIESWCTSDAKVSFLDKETNPTVVIRGIDENYFDVSSYNLEAGRNFTAKEIRSASGKCILGMDLVEELFNGKAEFAINKVITINSVKYKVIGVLESKGGSFGNDEDRRIFISITKAKELFGWPRKNYNVIVGTEMVGEINDAISAAYTPMRKIRRLRASEKDDFEIRKSDSVMKTLKDITLGLRVGTITIALITLLGASIGLMNIMLVSVTERTREIGVSKAIGAKRKHILLQFLTEAVVITQIGGVIGALLGIAIGNSVSLFVDTTFMIPWPWIILALVLCLFVGIISGIYPALKASRLDPIESLRYE